MNRTALRHWAKPSALLAIVLHGQTVWPATFSLNPAADSFVTSGPSGNLSGNNYGGAGALSVAAPGSPKGEFQSVLQFGLAGAKNAFDAQFGTGNWSVQSITLQLTSVNPNNLIFNANAAGQFGVSLMLNNTWTEGTGTPLAPSTSGITFSALPNFESALDEAVGTFSYTGGFSGATSYALTLSPTLTEDILAGGTVSLRMFAEDSSISYLFYSERFTTPTARPLLTIEAVPEPGVAVLSGVALGMLIWWRGWATKGRNRAERPGN